MAILGGHGSVTPGRPAPAAPKPSSESALSREKGAFQKAMQAIGHPVGTGSSPRRPSAPPRATSSGGGTDKSIITQAAQKYGIDPKILWGLYGTETAFGKNVTTSSAGAVGPFQFLPSTAKDMGVNPYDFKSAAFGAARYLSQYRARGVGGMLSAYNAGPAGGYQAGYVQSTLNNAKTYGGASGASLPSSGGVSLPSSRGVSLSSGGASTPEGVRAVVAQSMGLPRGVTTQSGGTEVVPNPKARGLQMLAQEERGSDPMLAQLLEAKAGEGTLRSLPGGIASTAAGIPATGSEAEALTQAPLNLRGPATSPFNLGGPKKQTYPALDQAKKALEKETGHAVGLTEIRQALKAHPERFQAMLNRYYGKPLPPGQQSTTEAARTDSKALESILWAGQGRPKQATRLAQPPPESPVVAVHHSGKVVHHPSTGVPLYYPNQRHGR